MDISSDIPKIRLTSNLTALPTEAEVGSYEFFSKDADGNYITGFIKSISSEQFGRKADLVLGSAGVNSTDATEKMRIKANGDVVLSNIQVFADNTSASSLPTGTIYRTSDGTLKIKF